MRVKYSWILSFFIFVASLYSVSAQGLPQMIGRGSETVIRYVFGNNWVVVLLVIVLFTVLFFHLFHLGLSFMPQYNEREHVFRNIAKILAMIASAGLFGFSAATRGPGAIIDAVNSVLDTTRFVAIWGLAVFSGFLSYFATKSANKGYNYPEDEQQRESRRRWCYVLISFFMTLAIGYGLLGDSVISMTFFVLLGITLIVLVIPSSINIKRKAESNATHFNTPPPFTSTGDTPAAVFPGDGPDEEHEENLEEDHKDDLDAAKVKKMLENHEDDFKKVKKKIGMIIKGIMIRVSYVARITNDEYQLMSKLRNNLRDYCAHLGQDDFNMNKLAKNYQKDFSSSLKESSLIKYINRNAKKEFKLLKTLSNRFGNLETDLKNLRSKLPEEFENDITSTQKILNSSKNYINQYDKILAGIQDGINQIKEQLGTLQNLDKEVVKILKSKTKKEKIKIEIQPKFEKMISSLDSIIANFDSVDKLSNFSELEIIKIRDLLNDFFQIDENLKEKLKELASNFETKKVENNKNKSENAITNFEVAVNYFKTITENNPNTSSTYRNNWESLKPEELSDYYKLLTDNYNLLGEMKKANSEKEFNSFSQWYWKHEFCRNLNIIQKELNEGTFDESTFNNLKEGNFVFLKNKAIGNLKNYHSDYKEMFKKTNKFFKKKFDKITDEEKKAYVEEVNSFLGQQTSLM